MAHRGWGSRPWLRRGFGTRSTTRNVEPAARGIEQKRSATRPRPVAGHGCRQRETRLGVRGEIEVSCRCEPERTVRIYEHLALHRVPAEVAPSGAWLQASD